MKWLRLLLGAAVAVALATTDARADDGAPRSSSSTGRNVMITGAAIFGAGYLPVAALGVPSAAGTYGRLVALFFTFALPCWGRGQDVPDDPNNGHRTPPNYLCNGTASGMELLVPFGGPFLYANDHGHDSVINPNGSALPSVEKDLLYASGALQIAGAAVFLVGGVITGFERDPKGADAPEKEGPRFSLLPAATPTSIGVSASLTAW